MKRFAVLLLLIIRFVSAFAQQSQTVEMADTLRSSGKIYVVIVTISVIFIGLAIFLFSIDSRLKKIEKENSSEK